MGFTLSKVIHYYEVAKQLKEDHGTAALETYIDGSWDDEEPSVNINFTHDEDENEHDADEDKSSVKRYYNDEEYEPDVEGDYVVGENDTQADGYANVGEKDNYDVYEDECDDYNEYDEYNPRVEDDDVHVDANEEYAEEKPILPKRTDDMCSALNCEEHCAADVPWHRKPLCKVHKDMIDVNDAYHNLERYYAHRFDVFEEKSSMYMVYSSVVNLRMYAEQVFGEDANHKAWLEGQIHARDRCDFMPGKRLTSVELHYWCKNIVDCASCKKPYLRYKGTTLTDCKREKIFYCPTCVHCERCVVGKYRVKRFKHSEKIDDCRYKVVYVYSCICCNNSRCGNIKWNTYCGLIAQCRSRD